MSFDLSIFESRQAFTVATVLVVLACVAAAVRLLLLPSAKEYRPFLGVLAGWTALNLGTIQINISSYRYFALYVILTPVLWLLYLLVARNLYQQVFSRYPGIAHAGKVALYCTGAVTAFAVTISLFIATAPFSASRALTVIEIGDQCILAGIAAFSLVLVSVIFRYPISIPRNIAVHCILFSAILLTQSVLTVASQLVSPHFSLLVNTLSSLTSAFLCIAWTVMLDRVGDERIVRVRQRLDPALEIRLLSQLDTLNGILLHAGRK